MSEQMSAFCPRYQRAAEIIGRRWTGAILRALIAGETRFGQIAHTVPGVSDRLLSERLKELETEGIVTRTVTPSTPVLVEYGLTDMGTALMPVVVALGTWAETYIDPVLR
jgi:DNA-binding HxlR family transcriptional regulator